MTAPLLHNSRFTSMSRVSTAHNGITGKRFWNLPAIGSVPAVTQAKASDNTSVTTRSSQRPSQPVARTEGCIVTRFVDLSNECTHFVSAPEHQSEKEQIVRYINIVPPLSF